MSLSSIFAIGSSGLQTAQTQLRAISDNIANVDTKGYVRKIVDQEPLVSGGVSSGVQVAQVRLAVDQFLQAAGLKANALATGATAAAGLWDQAQSLFGDPTDGSGFFGELDTVFAAFSTLAANPSSTAAKGAAVDQLGQFFTDASSISSQIDGLSSQADSRITADVDTVNKLLARIDSLNLDITRTRLQGGDASGSEGQQMQLIDQLSGLIDVRVQPRNEGGVVVRTGDGMVLAGQGGPAALSYDAAGPVGQLYLTPSGGSPTSINARLGGGEIKSLLDMRNNELPELKGQLAELVSGAADTLNTIHNSYSTAPPQASLKGSATGQDIATAIGGFTGKTTISVTDASGAVVRRVDVDFSAGTMTAPPGAPTSFTPGSFIGDLNTALGGAATASYSASGALTLTATGTGNGVAVADPDSGGSDKVGKGFSAFFGLNDLVVSNGAYDYATGLKPTDPHGFAAGGTIQFHLTTKTGESLTDVNFTIPAGATMNDLVTALNQPLGGVGLYGSFSLDADGELAFTSGAGVELSVVKDATARSDGQSMSEVFGIGEAARGARASGFSIRSDIADNPANLAMAKLDVTAGVGSAALSPGDARGADALAQAGQALHAFSDAGDMKGVTQSLSDYAASLSGLIGRKAEAAQGDETQAAALSAEANARRSSVEGVNLDQELINLTAYQQAYNASARVIQAAKDMYDVLLNMAN